MTITDEMIEAAIAAYGKHMPYHPKLLRAALEAVAPMIAAAEREECAEVASLFSLNHNPIHPDIPYAGMRPQARTVSHATCQYVAEAIRARVAK